MQVFVRVIESGSFSQAARELGVGQPGVSKQIAALERHFGTQLVHRTSRALRLSPAGADLYEVATQMLRDLDDVESRIGEAQQQPSGMVRIGTPPMLTGMTIVPELPDFLQRQPGIGVEFVISERYADLLQEGLDLAIRIGNLENSGLVARRIGLLQFATVASPAYASRHGMPSRPSDLHAHELLPNRYLGAIIDWHFAGSEQDLVTPPAGRFSCNSPADMRAAVLAGLGIAQSARAVFDAQLRSGEVVEVLAEFVAEPLPIHAIYCARRIPHRVRVVSDFIADCVGRQESLRDG